MSDSESATMTARRLLPGLFYIASAYDGVLGLVFLLFPLAPFRWCDVPPPNHMGYVQFPAALLIVFALMYKNIAQRPAANRNLIPYGILLKVCYAAVVFGHWFSSGLPNMWKPFAVVDVCFAVLFLWAYLYIGRTADAAPRHAGS